MKLRVIVVVEQPPAIVLTDAPLTAFFGVFAKPLVARPPVAMPLLGIVDPVVHRRKQTVRGVLDAVTGIVRIDEGLAVSDQIAVAVLREPERLVFRNEDAVRVN